MQIVALIAAILLVGLLTGANFFAFGACILLLVFQLARFFTQRWTGNLTARRSVSAHDIEAGETFNVAVEIHNQGRWYVPWTIVEDILPRRDIFLPPKSLQLHGKAAKLESMGRDRRTFINYKLEAKRRGYFQIGPTVCETGDLLGLHRQYRILQSPEYVLVRPKIEPISSYQIASRRPVGEIRVAYRSVEDPTLLVGIREYQSGDPINRVHWTATARTGKLHTKIFQPTTVAGAMLILDMHADSNPDRHEPMRTDLAATLAASIANYLYLQNQQFGLISNGRDAADRIAFESEHSVASEDRESLLEGTEMLAKSDRLRPIVIPADRGPEHFDELHRLLGRLERTDGLMLPDMLNEVRSRLPRDTSLIFIVQAVDESEAIAMGMLVQSGFAVSAIVNEPDDVQASETAGMLIAQRVSTHILSDPQQLQDVCRSAVRLR